MKKEIADLWVKALRSGEFQQGKESLCHDGAYCCLGVLCELASKEGVVRREELGDGVVQFGGGGDFPGREVVRWADLDSPTGRLNGHKALFALNDDEGWTFAEIADHIETHWEQL